MSFTKELLKTLQYHLESPECRYTDNSSDYYATGHPRFVEEDERWFNSVTLPSFRQYMKAVGEQVQEQCDSKSFLYEQLQDQRSKELLLKVAAYALLSHRLVKFPCYIPKVQEKIRELNKSFKCADPSKIPALIAQRTFDVGPPIALYDLAAIGMQGKAYCDPIMDILRYLSGEMYEYCTDEVTIKTAPGDVVFDCGAAYGDTAIMFASLAGESGMVYSFEPHPKMSKLLQHNISINPQLKNNIQVVSKAVSDKPDQQLSFTFGSVGSQTNTSHNRLVGTARDLVYTTSIDHEAAERGLNKVDFIKMDIEGAELDALLGAAETLKRFRPKLAISLYHKPSDFDSIPKLLHDMDLGYRFYFGHHYINAWESVLYAIAA